MALEHEFELHGSTYRFFLFFFYGGLWKKRWCIFLIQYSWYIILISGVQNSDSTIIYIMICSPQVQLASVIIQSYYNIIWLYSLCYTFHPCDLDVPLLEFVSLAFPHLFSPPPTPNIDTFNWENAELCRVQRCFNEVRSFSLVCWHL